LTNNTALDISLFDVVVAAYPRWTELRVVTRIRYWRCFISQCLSSWKTSVTFKTCRHWALNGAFNIRHKPRCYTDCTYERSVTVYRVPM